MARKTKTKSYTPHKPSTAQLAMWEVAKANGVQGYVTKIDAPSNSVAMPLKRTPYYATNTSVGFVRDNGAPSGRSRQVDTKLYLINQRADKPKSDPVYVWVTSLEVTEVQ